MLPEPQFETYRQPTAIAIGLTEKRRDELGGDEVLALALP
ncbi:hypothetical protein CKA32_004599 [Geitlerinema sp. FC II]|nr:hypothetical protein CKA32_004599 [Geitlerinema sp. FC II]